MKKYETPEAEVIEISPVDIIQASGEIPENYSFTEEATYTGKSATWLDTWN